MHRHKEGGTETYTINDIRAFEDLFGFGFCEVVTLALSRLCINLTLLVPGSPVLTGRSPDPAASKDILFFFNCWKSSRHAVAIDAMASALAPGAC